MIRNKEDISPRDRTVFLGTDQTRNGSFPKYILIIIEIDVGVSVRLGKY
jgi:hypothetical protein